jgi:hypothetical protein
MFKVKQESVKEMVTCKKCKLFFQEPVMLPCENNICQRHVLEATKNEEKPRVYKCEICFKDHKITEDGFILNRVIVNMMDLSLHLNEKTKKAKEIINDFDTVVQELKTLSSDPENFVYEYVHATVNKIDLERERLMLQIGEISEDMLGKLKSLEVECKSQLKSSNDYNNHSTTVSSSKKNRQKSISIS